MHPNTQTSLSLFENWNYWVEKPWLVLSLKISPKVRQGLEWVRWHFFFFFSFLWSLSSWLQSHLESLQELDHQSDPTREGKISHLIWSNLCNHYFWRPSLLWRMQVVGHYNDNIFDSWRKSSVKHHYVKRDVLKGKTPASLPAKIRDDKSSPRSS